MDAPEISTLREEEEETPPPEGDGGGLSFSKFRLNSVRLPSWGQGSASGSTVGPPVGPHPAGRRGPSPPDSEEEDEEDQLIDDDDVPMVARGPAVSSPASMAAGGSPPPSSAGSPRKRGGSVRGSRPRRGGATGRRGRPGKEPPDAAAMMSTFEVGKTEQAPPPVQILPPMSVPHPPLPQIPGPSTGDWSTSTPPKPPRKKPGPKKGTTLGPRGPRKSNQKSAHNTPGTSTPLNDDPLLSDPSAFLVPAPPSIPPTPGPDQSLNASHLPPILPPDFTLDPTIPVPVFPVPTRPFPVQAPPKIPAGYALTHPIDSKRTPARKWTIMQRQIKGIGGGRWFARTWVAPQTLPTTQPPTRPTSPHVPPDAAQPPLPAQFIPLPPIAATVVVAASTASSPPPQIPALPPSTNPTRHPTPIPTRTSPPPPPPPPSIPSRSRASPASERAEEGAVQALLQLDQVDATRWPGMTGLQPLPPLPAPVSGQDHPLEAGGGSQRSDHAGGVGAGAGPTLRMPASPPSHAGTNSGPSRAPSRGAPA